jgi:hypothetical protein
MIYTHFFALIPFYDPYGQNATRVILSDGTHEQLTCSVKTYIHNMLYAFHLDPKAIKFWTNSVIGTKINTPLVIDETFILLPVKFRHGVSKQDGCFGYVSLEAIKSYGDNSITLSTGEVLPTLTRKSYMEKKKIDASLLSYKYIDYKKQFEFMRKT